jgi:head-tail adaptor
MVLEKEIAQILNAIETYGNTIKVMNNSVDSVDDYGTRVQSMPSHFNIKASMERLKQYEKIALGDGEYAFKGFRATMDGSADIDENSQVEYENKTYKVSDIENIDVGDDRKIKIVLLEEM